MHLKERISTNEAHYGKDLVDFLNKFYRPFLCLVVYSMQSQNEIKV